MSPAVPVGPSQPASVARNGVPPLLTLPRAAQELSISKRTLERLIAAGKFPAPIRIGRSLRVPASDLSTYLEKLMAERGVKPGSS